MPTSTAATTTRASSPLLRPVSLIGTVNGEFGRIVAGIFMSSDKVRAARSIENHCTPIARPGMRCAGASSGTAQGRNHISARAPIAADRDVDARRARLHILRLTGDQTIGENVDREPPGRARGYRYIHRLAGLVVGFVERNFQKIRRVGIRLRIEIRHRS